MLVMAKTEPSSEPKPAEETTEAVKAESTEKVQLAQASSVAVKTQPAAEPEPAAETTETVKATTDSAKVAPWRQSQPGS